MTSKRRSLFADKLRSKTYQATVIAGSKTIGTQVTANLLLPAEVTKAHRIGPALTAFDTRFPNGASCCNKKSVTG